MILKDLLNEVDFDDVFIQLKDLYYEDKSEEELRDLRNNYFKVFSKLQNIRPDIDGENFCISIDKAFEWEINENDQVIETEESYWHVHGINRDTNEAYAIEFDPWSEWLGWDVSREQIKELGKNTYMAHILWEMTYSGFEESDIRDMIEELKSRVDSIKEELNDRTPNFDELEKEHEDIWIDEEEELESKIGPKHKIFIINDENEMDDEVRLHLLKNKCKLNDIENDAEDDIKDDVEDDEDED